MTRVSIVPVPRDNGGVTYRAIAGDKESQGTTAGEALDGITAQLDDGDAGMTVILQSFRPDRFFNAEQQRRMGELMSRWRAARDAGQTLPPDEQAELDALIEAELLGSAARVAAILGEPPP